MRIVYPVRTTIPSPAANSIQTVRMCQALAEAGHDVTLVVFDFESERRSATDWAVYYGLCPRFKCRRFALPRIRGVERIAVLLLAAWLAVNRPNLVYTRYLRVAGVTAQLGIPTAWEAHRPVDTSKVEDDRAFTRFVGGRGFRSLVVISSALSAHYQTCHGLPEGRICVAPDGADAAADEDAGTEEDGTAKCRRVRAGYAGNLYEGKGMELIAGLGRRCPEVEFHVAGGTESDREYWRSQLADLDNVHFHGSIAPGEVSTFLRRMDILLAPYQRTVRVAGGNHDIARWMSPLKIFEYMSVGRPIIASDLDVLREVLSPGNAILCAPDDVEEWANSIESLRMDPDRGHAIGMTAKTEFEQKFTWRARARRILDHISAKCGKY